MSREFTVLVSSTNDMTLNEIGELLNLIETRGIVIEEIHPGNVMSDRYSDGYSDGIAYADASRSE